MEVPGGEWKSHGIADCSVQLGLCQRTQSTGKMGVERETYLYGSGPTGPINVGGEGQGKNGLLNCVN